MMSWNRGRADDELPDTVVRMYREALDDDGLDFLKRGPRTGAERLAYAQRVHPEAYQTARPAPATARAVFKQRGLLDGRQHFVGPDRNLYERDETAVEPLHASIRRGFETVVPGFRSANFDDALAEAETHSGGGGAALLAGNAGDGGPATGETVSAGWQTSYEAGPLRMKEIQSWSRSATPEDAANLDPRLRKDILRYLRYESDRGRLTDAQHALGQAVYGGIHWDRATPMPHSAEMEEEFLRRVFADATITDAEANWLGLSPEARRVALERIVGHLSDVFGFPMPEVDYAPLSGPGNPPRAGGVYRPDQNQVVIDSISTMRPAGREGPMYNAAHEGIHPLQEYFGRRWARGELQANDPNYAAGEWAALTAPFKISARSTEPMLYRQQLREYWANRLGEALACEFQLRTTGTACR